MALNAMFAGLIYDESDEIVNVAHIGGDAHYVIDDMGFKRHVDAEKIDRQILAVFMSQLEQNKDLAVDQAMSMMGKDDIFTKAAVDAELRNVDIDKILGQGIPAQARDMLGMMGFKIIIDYRGELLRIDQPTSPMGDDGDY